jgi:cytochrome c553
MKRLPLVALLGSLAPILGVLACGGGTGVTTSAALPMQDHWDAGNALQHAMARGDLEAAREAAERIADVGDIPGLTWDAGPYLRDMRANAEQIQKATSFREAAEATGSMGAACGRCHARAEAGPHPEGTTTAPSAQDQTQSHMIQHAWAVDRMWEGLVVPSTDRWRAGARLLSEQSVAAHGVSNEVALISARVHEMGRQALDDDTPAERGTRFGQLLNDCAGCHAELGVW